MALVNVEALVIDVLKKPLNHLAVGGIIKGETAVFFDGEGIDLVSKGWGSQVIWFAAEPLGNTLHQPLAF